MKSKPMAVSIYRPYTEENLKKSAEELWEELWRDGSLIVKKEWGKIKGYTKTKEFECSFWLDECECGYNEHTKNSRYPYCPRCGELLHRSQTLTDRSAYKDHPTPQNEKEAIDWFRKTYKLPIKSHITCKETIKVTAWFKDPQK